MIKVGLTGGIGSGKSTVIELFKQQGVPVYIADVEAKRIMHSSINVIKSIKALFGDESYIEGILNRNYIADIVFQDKSKLEELNAIVHPAVQKDFEDFVSKQQAKYVVYESAILFENGIDNKFDFIILITAPEELRIERVLKRDKTTEENVKARINNQLSDHVKAQRSDVVISNIDLNVTKQEVQRIHLLLSESKN